MASDVTSIRDVQGPPCEHKKIYWDALRTSYGEDGVAIPWQPGVCSECNQSLTRPYLPDSPKAA